MADHVDKGLRKVLEIPSVYTFYQNLLYPPKQHLRYIRDYVQPFDGAKIMDIGCGPGTVLEYLLQIVSEIDYSGYDFNSEYIDRANQKYNSLTGVGKDQNSKKKIRFFCERVAKVASDKANQFDIVMANAILHHLNNEETSHLYETAFEALKPEGRLVTFDGVFIPNQNPVARWVIKKDRGQNVRTEKEQLKIAQKYFDKNETFIDHKFLNIPYTIIIGVHTK